MFSKNKKYFFQFFLNGPVVKRTIMTIQYHICQNNIVVLDLGFKYATQGTMIRGCKRIREGSHPLLPQVLDSINSAKEKVCLRASIKSRSSYSQEHWLSFRVVQLAFVLNVYSSPSFFEQYNLNFVLKSNQRMVIGDFR